LAVVDELLHPGLDRGELTGVGRRLGRGERRDEEQRGEQGQASGEHETGSSGLATVRGTDASANGTRPEGRRQPGSEPGAKPCRYTSPPDGSDVNSASRSASAMSGTPTPPTGDGAAAPPTSFGATKTWNSSAARAATRGPGGRAVNSGSSATSVPRPTTTASTRPRSSCTFARDSSELIHFESPVRVAILPSSVMAHLRWTHGRPVRRSFRYGALSRLA